MKRKAEKSKEIMKCNRLAAVHPKMNYKPIAEINAYKQSVAERAKKQLENDKLKKLEAVQNKKRSSNKN